MPRSDDSFERLRAALDEFAAVDAADLLTEARIEARARVRAMLTDALAHSTLERLHDQLDMSARTQHVSDLPAAASSWPTINTAKAGNPTPAAEPASASPQSRAVLSSDYAWYVYGVVAADAELDGALRSIDPTRPVIAVKEGSLAAVASEVSLDEFDEARLREHLADMVWVEATARAHEAVLDKVRAQTTVVPMRMCTLYRTEGGVREMLSREAAPLRDALACLDRKAEWGVKVFTRLARGDETTGDPDAGALGASGAAYMERIRNEREVREWAMEVAEEAAAQIHDSLSAVASDSQVIPLQCREVSGHDGEMILNGVYLVADDATPTFYEEVQELRSEFETNGIEIAFTGPWPAYNFVPGTIGAAW